MEGSAATGGKAVTRVSGKPVISIITVVFNGAGHLEQAIRSVADQAYQNIEYIVIDGGSTDGTLNIIRKYEDSISYWLSEADTGIYDAMNKGLDKATGEWLYFLGADDMLYSPHTIEKFVAGTAGNVGLVLGSIEYSTGRKFVSGMGIKTLLHNTVHHQGAFYHVRNFKNWHYDNQLQLIADYELNLRLFFSHVPFVIIDETVALCSDRGVSRTQLDRAFQETNQIRRRFLSAPANLLCSLIYWMEFSAYRLMLIVQRNKEDAQCQK